jgi:foldase protein PrsA
MLLLVCLIVSLGLVLWGCSRGGEPTAAGPQDAETSATSPEDGPATTEDRPTDEEAAAAGHVAYVNGEGISEATFEEARVAVLSQYQQIYAQFGMSIDAMLTGARGRLFELAVESEALDRTFLYALFGQEAAERGIEITQEDVDAEFDAQYAEFLASQGMTHDDWVLQLAVQGTTYEEFKADVMGDMEAKVLMDKVLDAVAGAIELSEEELADHFEANRAQYAEEEEIRASHILVETEDEAQEILDDLDAGADFGELAGERSLDPGSGAQAGDLGWFGRGRMVPAFEEAAFALEVGETSGIIHSDFGFHVIRLDDRKEATDPTLDDVRDDVRADLEAEIRQERGRAWYEETYAAATFDVRMPLVEALMLQRKDNDAGIEAFEGIREEGASDDPYLPFILGTLYESRASELSEQRDALDPDAEDFADRDAELEAEIRSARETALAEMRLALDAVGDDPGILDDIESLEAALAPAEEEPQPEE